MNTAFWNPDPGFENNIMLLDPENETEATYGMADEEIKKIASYLPSGKKLAFLFCKNNYRTVLYYLALLRKGHAVLLLDSKLNAEIKNNLASIYKPDLIFGDIWDHPGYMMEESDGEFFFYSSSPGGTIHPDLAVLLSTSGTTGSPKLVKLSYKNIIANALSITDYLEIKADQRAVTSLPMSYSFGLSVINSHILSGASILLTDKSFVFKDFWNLFNAYRCTSFSGVPYTYELLKKTNFGNLEFANMKVMTQAGGRLSSELIKYFSDLSAEKKFRFYVMYGQTEATARISYVPYESLPEKIGSIGIPIPGGDIKIFSDREEIKIPGVEGELVYSGDNVMMGYAECRDDLLSGDQMNGVLRTGDLGYMDSDGFFYITGRLKRFIKVFGLRLNLDDVEKYIESEFGIFNACSGTDDRLNILINKGEHSDSDEILQKVSRYYKIKKSVITLKDAEKMPVNESGKKDYNAISRLF